jgi:hypothetical protein
MKKSSSKAITLMQVEDPATEDSASETSYRQEQMIFGAVLVLLAMGVKSWKKSEKELKLINGASAKE